MSLNQRYLSLWLRNKQDSLEFQWLHHILDEDENISQGNIDTYEVSENQKTVEFTGKDSRHRQANKTNLK